MTDQHNWILVPGVDSTAASELRASTVANFDLLNEYVLERFVYRKREYGINLGWAALDQSNPALFARSRSGNSVIVYGERIAIGVRGGSYLRYGHQEYGINLRWSGSPVYEWRLMPEDSSLAGTPVRFGPLTGVLNDNDGIRDYLFYDPRRYGINLKWLQDKGKHNSRSWTDALGDALRGIGSTVANFGREWVGRIVNLPEFLLSLIGFYLPRTLRAKVVILRDESGAPLMMDDSLDRDENKRVEDEEQFWKAIAAARRCLNQMNVTLELEGPASTPWEVLPYPAPTKALDVRCDKGALGDDWGEAGRYFRRYTTKRYWRQSLTLFIVREIEKKRGCSLGPLSNYVTLGTQERNAFSDFIPDSGDPPADEPRPTTLIHEIGHACSLWHTGGPPPAEERPARGRIRGERTRRDHDTTVRDNRERRRATNLMKSGTPRGVRLRHLQRSVFRSARYLGYNFGTTGVITNEPSAAREPSVV